MDEFIDLQDLKTKTRSVSFVSDVGELIQVFGIFFFKNSRENRDEKHALEKYIF
jgi:hypothetical protein